MVLKIIKKNTPLLLCPAALVISAVTVGDSMVTEGDLLVDIQRVNSVTHMDQTRHLSNLLMKQMQMMMIT